MFGLSDKSFERLAALYKKAEDELIEGGLAESFKGKFDVDQLVKGLKVEMEHTDDPKIALEIAMDHLTEIDDYYDRLEEMEKGE